MGTVSATEIDRFVLEFTSVQMAVSGTIELVRSERNPVVLRVLEGNPEHMEIGVRNGVLHFRYASAMTMRFRKKNLRVNGKIHLILPQYRF